MKTSQFEKRLLIFIPACISLLHVISVIRLYGENFALISLLYIPLRFLSWGSLRFTGRPAGMALQGLGDIGFFCWIALYPNNLNMVGVSGRAMGVSMLIGAIVLSIHAIINLLVRRKLPEPVFTRHYWKTVKNDYVWIAFTGLWVVAFLFVIISHVTGIATMGVEVRVNAILPFRLAGILMYSRIYAVPMFAILFIDYFSERRMKTMFYVAVVLLLLFSFAEAYIRLSRGVVIINTIALFIWALYRGKFSTRLVVLCGCVLSGVTLMYPYLSRLRNLLGLGDYGQGVGGTLKDLVENKTLFGEMDLGFLDSFYAVVIRGASEGLYMSKFLDHLNFRILGGHLEHLKVFNDVANYHTRVIDGVGANVPHNSGITLYTDSLFIGGIFMVLGTAIVFSWLAYCIDARKLGLLTGNPALQASVSFFYFSCLIGGVISKIFLRVPVVVLVLPLVWLAMYFLFKLMNGIPGGEPILPPPGPRGRPPR